jgi:hypothetical protein
VLGEERRPQARRIAIHKVEQAVDNGEADTNTLIAKTKD